MKHTQWDIFCEFRDTFKKQCQEWNISFQDVLQPLQRAVAIDTPYYPVETSVVYNNSLNDVQPEDDIKAIIIGDNPGKDEQRSYNRRYLVGQSGKIAASFYAKNPELGIDFRKNTIILNKTPVHTAKTIHLRSLAKGNSAVSKLIVDSQVWMAKKTAALHQQLLAASCSDSLPCELHIVGYGELKNKGIFIPYRDALHAAYKENPQAWESVRVYQHYSMNRFSIDLKSFAEKNNISELPLAEQLAAVRKFHRDEIFPL